MSRRPSRSGKTSPRLLIDLLNYDPRRANESGRNTLCDEPPLFDDSTRQFGYLPPSRSCRHEFMIKQKQSKVPDFDYRPTAEDYYTVAAYCASCAYHLKLVIDYRQCPSNGRLCPNKDFPLHHFIHLDQNTRPGEDARSGARTFWFCCSAEECRAQLSIELRPPFFSDQELKHLTNPEALIARLDHAQKIEQNRSGFEAIRAVDVFDILTRYLRDALADPPGSTKVKRIPARNKKFMVAFGQDCDEILNRLKFRIEFDEQGDSFWRLPQPSNDTERAVLEDAREELLLQVQKTINKESLTVKNFEYYPQPALKQIERTLGSLDYAKTAASRRSTMDYPKSGDPLYLSLGAVDDFSDLLVYFAYERQSSCDYANAAYYFDCLRKIAQDRGVSGVLGEKVQLLASRGVVGQEEIFKAYKDLGIDPRQKNALSDQIILGQFKSRLEDSPQWQQADLRSALRTVGEARQSKVLLQAASNTLETYDQALSWLGIGTGEEVSDEFVLTYYSIKANEDPSNKETGRKAIQIIADHRKSEALKSWLLTGEMDSEENLAWAYQTLQIPDRSSPLDPENLGIMVQTAIEDNPSRREDFLKAFEMIKKHGNTSNEESGPVIKHNPKEWPVGLKNIGNTCYLNSLLQFYFSVKPVRRMVLDINSHLMDMTPGNLQKKQAGGRKVSTEEVARAQEFVQELQKLFAGMIQSPEPVVKPDVELAILTLPPAQSKTSTEADFSGKAKESNETSKVENKPEASKEASKPEIKDDEKMQDAPSAKEPAKASKGVLVRKESVESDDTLVDGIPTPTDSEPQDMEDVITGVDASGNTKDETGQAEEPKLDVATTEGKPKEGTKSPPEKVTRPPPLPPRSDAATQKAATELAEKRKREAENAAKQQDVTEAMDHLLFQLHCATKAEAYDDAGGQIDLIKRLFYFSVTRAPVNPTSKLTVQKEIFNNIIARMTEGPKDIYGALDGFLDIEQVSFGGKLVQRFATLDNLPPLLQISVNRVVFQADRQKKVFDPLTFDETLYMDRYLHEPGSDLTERRKRSWVLKKELKRLADKKASMTDVLDGQDVAGVLDGTSAFLQSLSGGASDGPIDVDLLDRLHEKAASIRKEMPLIEGRMAAINEELGSLFVPFHKHEYRLFAVIMQVGEAISGHYWIYIKDFQTGVWRKYNDETVSEVSNIKVIVEQESGMRPATPYFLVYVQAGLEEEMTQPLDRQIPEEVQQQEDVEVLPDAADEGNQGSMDQEMTDVGSVEKSRSGFA